MRAGDFNLLSSADDNLGQFRLIQAEQRFRSAYRWLADFESATWAEVRIFLSSFCPPGQMFELLLGRVREFEDKGVRPFEVHDPDRGRLDDELRIAASEFRRGLDPLSLIGSTISPLDQSDTLPWRVISEWAWLGPFAGSGGFLTVTGPPRMGKTGLACNIAEMWLRSDPEAVVLSNVILREPVDRFYEAPSLSALVEHVRECINGGRRWLWVFDDAGLEWLKQQAMRGSSIDLEKFARIVPKHGGSFIYIDQREGGIPTTISEFSESRVRCLRPGFALVRLPDLVGAVRDVPKPRTPYISEARSSFLIDLTFEDLVAEIPRPPEAVA